VFKILAVLAPIVAVAVGVGLAWVMGAAGVSAFWATGYGDFLAALPRRAFSQLDKIGRASCRERV